MYTKSREEMTERELNLVHFKFGILANGIKIADDAVKHLDAIKHPIRTRSGVSGGLDINLGFDVYVNAPVKEAFAQTSNFSLHFEDNKFIVEDDVRDIKIPVTLLKEPAYYKYSTSIDEIDMKRIGQMCSPDRFCYGMTGPGCYFWKPSKRCKYCSIGDNYSADASRKKAKHLMEVLEFAINDPEHPAQHILLGGGTPPGEDMGANLASELCQMIKNKFDISIYVMISAPLKNKYIDQLHDAGADELGMNIEFWSDEAWQTYIPGKYAEIGKSRYLEALEYSVTKFGKINTRSILIGGLENPEHTLAGVQTLASMGVMPIISPFRPLTGTMLETVQSQHESDRLGV